MRSTRRLLEISFLMMAVLSGLLLSTSLGSPSYLLVGGLGALGGLILVDWTGWIRMPTFVANLLSFVVLYLSMRGFFANETSGQLGSVANLLVYLQTLLVLQDKGPRQYWQLMVLSFLQLVVASVFHVQLEGGVLFLAYMATSAIFLVLLNSYSQTWTSYSRDVRKVTSGIPASRSAKYFASSAPEVVSEIRPNRMVAISNMLRHVTSWIMACLAFASVLFILIPRSDVTWFTGRTGQTIMAGSSKGVNLDERGRIELSYSSIMKAQFRRSRRGDGIQLDSPAYFRTMAMNTLVVENGNSTWKAPYDRVYNWQPIARPPYQGRCVMVHVAHEPTLDPALSTVDPVFDDAESPIFGYYSNDLSLIARSDVDTEIEMIPFHYQFWVPLLPNTNTLPDSFPYLYLDRLNSTITMRENPAEFKSLTSIDRTRYSGIIAIGDQLVQELGSANDLLIAKKLESWFLDMGRFQYTLDYTNVPRQEGLDSIEDFVVNHRQGHCEMFASGLAVMLRSQGIPARMAIGFYGGSYIADQKTYQITGGHAHAWVEAYIAPEFCTEQMFKTQCASSGGAWVRLDATPPSDLRDQFANGSDPINLARNLWQDYVLRMDFNKQPTWGDIASSVVAGALDLSAWATGMELAMLDVQARPGTYSLALGSALLVISFVALVLFQKPKKRPGTSSVKRSPLAKLRRALGKTLGVLAPGLGRWIQGESNNFVWFFDRLNDILAKEGVERESTVTYEEFAQQASKKLATGDKGPEIGLTIQIVIDRFQQVRFGGTDVASIERPTMEANLSRLADLLRERAHRLAAE